MIVPISSRKILQIFPIHLGLALELHQEDTGLVVENAVIGSIDEFPPQILMILNDQNFHYMLVAFTCDPSYLEGSQFEASPGKNPISKNNRREIYWMCNSSGRYSTPSKASIASV
jgi:hypothetical protein